MSPETAVARLTEIVAARAKFSEDDIYVAMAEAGIPDAVADRAYKFTQIAWGRIFLAGLGVRFSPDYLCFNAAGDVVESGLLPEQPYFAAAMQLAKQYARSPGFPRFAAMSSDVNAVNSALKAGSKPENLVAAPAALFLEAPTPSGIEKARQILSRQTAPSPKAGGPKAREAAVKNPWGRFWQ